MMMTITYSIQSLITSLNSIRSAVILRNLAQLENRESAPRQEKRANQVRLITSLFLMLTLMTGATMSPTNTTTMYSRTASGPKTPRSWILQNIKRCQPSARKKSSGKIASRMRLGNSSSRDPNSSLSSTKI